MFVVIKSLMICCEVWRLNICSSVYLVDNILIVANEVLEGHDGFPGVILCVDAAAADLAVFVSGYS